MYYYSNASNPMPMAGVAINKSRLKVYKGEIPTYYLEKGAEFQLEIFNPTLDTILAKIELNGKEISQAGLVLRPGERVFLDRYLDVPNKFKFDTYEVSNTEEVKQAIAKNGDLVVRFYREKTQQIYWGSAFTTTGAGCWPPSYTSLNDTNQCYFNASVGASCTCDGAFTQAGGTYSHAEGLNTKDLQKRTLSAKLSKSKSIETGRVEQGAHSDQKFTHVNKEFEYWAFHTIQFKLLPLSQKVNTTSDLNVRRYCTNCGGKLKPTFKHCPFCGSAV